MNLKTIITNKAFKISFLYLLFGAAWILVSDSILDYILDDYHLISHIQTYKGWFYVLLTGAFLYYLIKLEIDRRDKIENELRKSQSLFNDVADNAEEWIWEVDKYGIYTYSSPAVQKLLGYSVDEIIGKQKLYNLFHPNEREYLEEQAREFQRQKKSFKKFQHRKQHKNGKDVWILTSAIPIIDKNNELLGYRGTDFDISERIEKEILLKESEERHRNLSELTFEGILIHQEGKIVDFNNVFLKMTGYNREEILGRDIFEFFIAEDYLDLVKHNVSINHTYPYQFDGIRKGGERYRFETIARDVEYKGKKARVAALRDITWRLESERKLRESEERYRNLAELTFEGLVIHDEGRIIDFNSTFQKMSEYSKDELIGKKFFELIPQEYHDIVRKKMSKQYVPPYEFEAVTKSGRRIWFEVTSRTTEFDGRPARVSALRDISWRIQAEIRLKESEERYRNIFDAHSSGIIIFNNKKEIVMANPAAYDLFGYSSNEMKGLSIKEITTENPPEVSLDRQQSEKTGKKIEFDTIDLRKDGTTFRSNVILRPFMYNQEEHVLALVNDITEKKLAEEELSKYKNHLEILVEERTAELEAVNRLLEREISKQKEAEQKVKAALIKEKELSELKSGFLSMASHEFRTPLTSILSSADLLDMAGRTWDDEKYLSHINKIRNSVSNMTTLLNDVLTISRTQDGKIKRHDVTVDLDEFSNEIISEIKVLSFYNHNIQRNLSGENKVITDPKLLRQCIENLVVNAVKYSPPESFVILDLIENSGNLEITVKDYGPGITVDELDKIFEPFYRIKTANKVPGSGLGLAIVKNAVDTLEGNISVQSDRNMGTTFKITIPLKKQQLNNE